MFTIAKKEMIWAGRPLVLETGKVARQADGAVMVSYGDTRVLCTAVAAKEAKPDVDFFPLTVNYQEKMYAAGRIPGGYFKRETRPTEKETLASRLIDRPIRPLFHDAFRNETQVICTVMSSDDEADTEIAALIGASAALTLSGVPFMGPIAGARVGYIDGKYILNPTPSELEASQLDMIAAGTRDAVLMVESEAKELSEEVMLGAVMFVQEECKPVLDLIIALAESAAKTPWDIAIPDTKALEKKVAELAEAGLRKAYDLTGKQERSQAIAEVKSAVKKALVEEAGENKVQVGSLLKKLESNIVRTSILKTGKRIDGRDGSTIRPILAEVDILPRVHGSALFTRGETQAIVTTTLGTGQDEQITDGLSGDTRDNFMLHYNFPPYSVGEAGFLRAPGRREIGHGRLAKRSLAAVMPSKEEFAYTIRLVSEITESNGSSSMATVCGGALSMMAAGVPLTRPVAGIAMGLIKEGKDFAVLSDIMGDEDHLGDMDFKVAGTSEGVTALQMDIKIDGITEEIMKVALKQAHEGRNHILGEMGKALDGSRDDVSSVAPRIVTIQIDKDKIREVIGTGGKVIREITEATGVSIDIEQDGTIRVAGTGGEGIDDALQRINDIVQEPEVGKIYDGKVVDIVDFGAFVQFMGPRQGLVHISELAFDRVESVGDVLKVDDEIKVKCIGMDRGKVRLSYRMANQETGEDAELPEGFEMPVARPNFSKGRDGGKGGRGGDRGDRRPRSEGEGGGDERPQRRRRPF